MKKVIALVLALVMILALATTAFAADTKSTSTMDKLAKTLVTDIWKNVIYPKVQKIAPDQAKSLNTLVTNIINGKTIVESAKKAAADEANARINEIVDKMMKDAKAKSGDNALANTIITSVGATVKSLKLGTVIVDSLFKIVGNIPSVLPA